MNHHLTAGLVAAAVAIAAVAAGPLYAPKPRPNVINVTAGPSTPKTVARLAAMSWGELEQREVDGITSRLKAISPSTPVVVFCMEERYCGDMALDFENAFESAHWPVRQERPLADDTIGIGTNDQRLADLIEKATAGRLKPIVIKANMPGQWALVLGKKPR